MKVSRTPAVRAIFNSVIPGTLHEPYAQKNKRNESKLNTVIFTVYCCCPSFSELSAALSL